MVLLFTPYYIIFIQISCGPQYRRLWLSPGLTKEQLDVDYLMKTTFTKYEGNLAGIYFLFDAKDQTLVKAHLLYMLGYHNIDAHVIELRWPDGKVRTYNITNAFLCRLKKKSRLV